jgi:hypothetical protein
MDRSSASSPPPPFRKLPASLPLEGRFEPPLCIVAFRREDDDKGEDLGACEDSDDGDPEPAVRCEEKSDSKSQQRKSGKKRARRYRFGKLLTSHLSARRRPSRKRSRFSLVRLPDPLRGASLTADEAHADHEENEVSDVQERDEKECGATEKEVRRGLRALQKGSRDYGEPERQS